MLYMTTYFIAFLFKIDADALLKQGTQFGMTLVILNSFQDLNTQNMRNYLCRHV